MRILFINPNITASITETMAAEARRFAAADTERDAGQSLFAAVEDGDALGVEDNLRRGEAVAAFGRLGDSGLRQGFALDPNSRRRSGGGIESRDRIGIAHQEAIFLLLRARRARAPRLAKRMKATKRRAMPQACVKPSGLPSSESL